MWDSVAEALMEPSNLLIGWNLQYMFPSENIHILRVDDRLTIAKMMVMYSSGTLRAPAFLSSMSSIAQQSGIPYTANGSHCIETLAEMTIDSMNKTTVLRCVEQLYEDEEESSPQLRNGYGWAPVELALLIHYAIKKPSWSKAAHKLRRTEDECKIMWHELQREIQRYITEDFVPSPVAYVPEEPDTAITSTELLGEPLLLPEPMHVREPVIPSTPSFQVSEFCEPVHVQTPVTTLGLRFDSRHCHTVDIQCPTRDGRQRSVPFAVKSITAIEVFENYTIEEIRYFDYVQTGVCFPAQ